MPPEKQSSPFEIMECPHYNCGARNVAEALSELNKTTKEGFGHIYKLQEQRIKHDEEIKHLKEEMAKYGRVNQETKRSLEDKVDEGDFKIVIRDFKTDIKWYISVALILLTIAVSAINLLS